MNHTEFKKLDGLALSSLIEKKEVTPHDLMAVSIDIAKQVDERLDFLCYEKFDESLALSKNWQNCGPFNGIPFLLKDSGLASKRFQSSIGSNLFKGTTYPSDSTLVQRFDAAGFITYARSTVPEFCMAPTTEAKVYGKATRNPWDLNRSPGGSSGGAAAAVAAGVVPVAHGSDGGGSIRIPAACCGIYGFKPSRGLVPMGPTRGEGWGGLAVDGVLSRSVRDTAAAMDAISGSDPGAPYASPHFPRTFGASIQPAQRRKLRIGVWREGFQGVQLSPEVLDGLDRTIQLCRDLGHEIVELATPAFDYANFIQAHTNILASNIVVSVEAKLSVLQRALDAADLEHAIRTGYEYGKTLPSSSYIGAINTLHQISRLMSVWMSGLDVLMTPALNQLPATLGDLSMEMEFMALRKKISNYSCFLAIINASGQPAAALPTHWTAAGLPVATQIIGHFGADDLILSLSAEIEDTGNWHPRHHDFHG